MNDVAVQAVDFDNADEVRTPDKTKVEVVRVGTGTVARFTLQPGWTWESCIKPIVGTDSCKQSHLGYVESGSILITADDGTEMEFTAGSVYALMPGHHAEVTSDEPFVAVEFDQEAAESYAQDEEEDDE